MRTVEPAKPRSRISETPAGRRIVIPAPRHVVALFFLSFWLCAWVVGLLVAGRMLFRDVSLLGPSQLFALVWLAGWTIGGLFTVYRWLWMLAGEEVITVDGTSLVQRRQLYAWGHGQRFDLSLVRALRVSPPPLDAWGRSAGLRYWGFGNGTIAFDYGARTYRFGDSLAEAEAKIIVQAICERFPQLREGVPW